MVHFKSSSFSHIINLTSFHHVLLITHELLFLIEDYIKYQVLMLLGSSRPCPWLILEETDDDDDDDENWEVSKKRLVNKSSKSNWMGNNLSKCEQAVDEPSLKQMDISFVSLGNGVEKFPVLKWSWTNGNWIIRTSCRH